MDKKEYEVNAFFMHHGVGIAHPLENGSSFSFLAFAYSHSTSFCYLVRHRDSKVVLANHPGEEVFALFAWGNNATTNRRQNYIQIGGDAPRVYQQTMYDHAFGLLPDNGAFADWMESLTPEARVAFRTGRNLVDPQMPPEARRALNPFGQWLLVTLTPQQRQAYLEGLPGGPTLPEQLLDGNGRLTQP